jgi:putative membrane-bound dehydrogenase-like protein
MRCPRFLHHFRAISCVLLAIALLPCAAPSRAAGTAEPALRALSRFNTESNLVVELVASEPLVTSPCALAWDDQGRMFVAENRGYPTGATNGRPLGRIALLTDTKRVGTWDRRTDYATDLTFPNGMLPWRGGLIVTCAPDILWLRDENGDGVAETREVILTGFATHQSTQLRVNHPILGPDGWVYVASGLSGGRITSPRRPQDKPLELRGDLRFNPDTGEYQSVDGPSQFGLDIDDYGHRFGCHNRIQVRHFVFPPSAALKHPFLIPPGVVHDCPDRIDNPWLKAGGGAAMLYPISSNVTTADSHSGTFTAACSVLLWPGGQLPERYSGGVFSCDPTANLVHFDQLQPTGATFAARRLPGTNEFLRSPDNWFRPVFLAAGPEGALYIADMYRPSIEHPEYLPEEVRRRTDFETGRDLGRIWRVRTAPPRTGTRRTFRNPPVVHALTNQHIPLLNDLSSTNRWRRDTAFRLLREQETDTNLPPILQRGLEYSRTPITAGRLLQFMARLGILSDDAVLGALAAPVPELRELGLRLAEGRLLNHAEIAAATASLARDESPRVRFQAALTLGTIANEAPALAVPALATIAARDGADRWTRAAVLNAVHEQERGFIGVLLNHPPVVTDPALPVLEDLGAMIGRMVQTDAHAEVVATILRGPNTDLARSLAFLGAFVDATPELPVPMNRLAGQAAAGTKWTILQEAALSALDRAEALPSLRLAAVRLTSQLDPTAARAGLTRILRAPGPTDLVTTAARRASIPPHSDLAAGLLAPEVWKSLPPPNQSAVLTALLARPVHLPQLVTALTSGVLHRHQFSAGQREQLLAVADPNLREQARRILQAPAAKERQEALIEARKALGLTGDPNRGRTPFRQLCAACHRLDGEGVAVGPDLFSVRNQSIEAILLHIVLPGQEIAPHFAHYRCATRDGRVLSGLLVAESPAAITLRQAQGLEETMERANIQHLEVLPESLMPEGLEKSLTSQELADLLAFLRGGAR